MNLKCKTEGCTLPHHGNGFCKICYRKDYRYRNKEALAAASRAYYLANLEKVRENNKLYREANKDSTKAYVAEWHRINKAKVDGYKRKWEERNKESKAERGRRYRKENPLAVRALTAKHRAKRKRATPPWADLAAIRTFYLNCPQGHEVDHIIPISGKEVRGLHVLHNLQYLPREVNRRKSNKVA